MRKKLRDIFRPEFSLGLQKFTRRVAARRTPPAHRAEEKAEPQGREGVPVLCPNLFRRAPIRRNGGGGSVEFLGGGL